MDRCPAHFPSIMVASLPLIVSVKSLAKPNVKLRPRRLPFPRSGDVHERAPDAANCPYRIVRPSPARHDVKVP